MTRHWQRDSHVSTPMTCALNASPAGNRAECQGHQAEPSDQLSPNSGHHDIENDEHHGESHELVTEEALLEYESQAEGGREQGDERNRLEHPRPKAAENPPRHRH